MEKIFYRTLVFGLTMLFVISSCTSSSEDVVADQTLGHCLSYAQDIESKAQSFDRLSFVTQFNYSNNTVDIAITGIVLPQTGSTNGQRFPKMSFHNLPWQYNEYGWKVINVSDVTPEIVGVSTLPVFKNLTFMLLDVFDGSSYAPGIQYKFVVAKPNEDSSDYVEIVGCCINGKTISTNPTGDTYSPEGDVTVTEKNKPTYWIDFNFEKSTADIYLYNAKFISTMPSLNLVFPGVDISVNNGLIVLTSDALIPEYDKIPFNAFPISQLKGTVDFVKGTTLDFHCNYRGSDYTITFEGSY